MIFWWAGWLFTTELIKPSKWYMELIMLVTWPADLGKFIHTRLNK